MLFFLLWLVDKIEDWNIVSWRNILEIFFWVIIVEILLYIKCCIGYVIINNMIIIDVILEVLKKN